MPIDKEKLEEIDKAIDAEIVKQPLLKRSRDEALFHLITVYERFVNFEASEASADVIDHFLISKSAQDGIDFAIQWVYKYCQNTNTTNYKLKANILREAKQLLDNSMEYSKVWDYMTLLFRDMCLSELSEDNTITLNYNPIYRKEKDIANRFLNSTDDLHTTTNEIESFLASDPRGIMEEIGFTYKNNNVVYTLSDNAYVQLYKVNFESKTHLLELNETWDLGGYTVKEFSSFYFYLRTVTTAHMMGCMLMHSQNKNIANTCLRRDREQWIKNINENIIIRKEATNKIFDDLIYDPTLYGSNKKTPDVTYQPFIKMKDGSFLLFNSIVQQSNFERNHWDLLSIIRQEFHSRLRNNKEELWRNELSEFCNKLNLKVLGPISFSLNEDSSDIDFIIIDTTNKIILLVELKWLTSPDRIKDIIYVSEEIKKGLDQVELALKYFAQSKKDAANKLSIDLSEFDSYKIFGLVLSKNSMGNGFTHSDIVPCINERIFKSVLGDPHKKNIEILWKVAQEQRFMPQENVHYSSNDSDASFGSYKFISKDTGMNLIRQFDLTRDLNFEGIEK